MMFCFWFVLLPGVTNAETRHDGEVVMAAADTSARAAAAEEGVVEVFIIVDVLIIMCFVFWLGCTSMPKNEGEVPMMIKAATARWREEWRMHCSSLCWCIATTNSAN